MGLKYTKRAMTSYEVHRFFHGLESPCLSLRNGGEDTERLPAPGGANAAALSSRAGVLRPGGAGLVAGAERDTALHAGVDFVVSAQSGELVCALGRAGAFGGALRTSRQGADRPLSIRPRRGAGRGQL